MSYHIVLESGQKGYYINSYTNWTYAKRRAEDFGRLLGEKFFEEFDLDQLVSDVVTEFEFSEVPVRKYLINNNQLLKQIANSGESYNHFNVYCFSSKGWKKIDDFIVSRGCRPIGEAHFLAYQHFFDFVTLVDHHKADKLLGFDILSCVPNLSLFVNLLNNGIEILFDHLGSFPLVYELNGIFYSPLTEEGGGYKLLIAKDPVELLSVINFILNKLEEHGLVDHNQVPNFEIIEDEIVENHIFDFYQGIAKLTNVASIKYWTGYLEYFFGRSLSEFESEFISFAKEYNFCLPISETQQKIFNVLRIFVYSNSFIYATYGAVYFNLKDPGLLDYFLKSEFIRVDKDEVEIGTNGAKVFYDLYYYLMLIPNHSIRFYLRFNFPKNYFLFSSRKLPDYEGLFKFLGFGIVSEKDLLPYKNF